MIPIFEQGKSLGIGLSYDFENNAIRYILKSQGGFAELDRLSGNKLSFFYLHSNNPELIDSFNYAFDVEENISMPFVMFLKFDGEVEEIEDLKISILEQDNYPFAFKELYSTIEDYVKHIDNRDKEIGSNKNKLLQVFNKYKGITLKEFIKLFFDEVYKKHLH